MQAFAERLQAERVFRQETIRLILKGFGDGTAGEFIQYLADHPPRERKSLEEMRESVWKAVDETIIEKLPED